MGFIMYDEQFATEILKALNKHYPDRLHFQQLRADLQEHPVKSDQEWLRAIDALQGDGKITGKFLRSGLNQIEDAAMLRITPFGRDSLERDRSKRQVRLDARLNIPDAGEFDRDLEQCCHAASASRPLSVIVVDIDHFKNVNDSYGHEMGNDILKRISVTLTDGCYGKAKVYRYGGDEITILAENYTLPEAAVLAERLRTQIAELRSADDPPRVTASIGVSSFPNPVNDAKALFKFADEAAYEAKKNGRNQVRTTASNNARHRVPAALTGRSLSVYMRTDERVRWLDERIATESGQSFNPAEDASLTVLEKANYLTLRTIDDLAVLVTKFADTCQKLSRCFVPTTPVVAGHSLNYLLDIAAARNGETQLRLYFQSLRHTTTAEEYIPELIQTLALIR